jgi:hypothetical protein
MAKTFRLHSGYRLVWALGLYKDVLDVGITFILVNLNPDNINLQIFVFFVLGFKFQVGITHMRSSLVGYNCN